MINDIFLRDVYIIGSYFKWDLKKIYDFVCCFKPVAVIIEPVLMIAGFAASFALLVGETYNPFLYFRF